MSFILGGIGVLFLLAVIGVAVFSAPTTEDPDDPQAQQEQAAPSPPAKKPPLN